MFRVPTPLWHDVKAPYDLAQPSFSSPVSIPCSHLPSLQLWDIYFSSHETLLLVVLMFQSSVPSHILLPFPWKSHPFLDYSLNISKCSMSPLLPNKSFSANSILYIVEFLHLFYYDVIIYVPACHSICTIIGVFINSLLSGYSV